MARLVFSINKNTAEPFTNKWPGNRDSYIGPTTTVTKNVILGDGSTTTIDNEVTDPDFFMGNPLNISCRHMGDIDNKSYFGVRDSDFITWTDEEKTTYGYEEELLPLSEADTNLLILNIGDDSSNTEILTVASDNICNLFLDSNAANTAQAQADAEAFGYNFANTYTFNG